MCILVCNIGFGLYSTIGDLMRRYKQDKAEKALKRQQEIEDKTMKDSDQNPRDDEQNDRTSSQLVGLGPDTSNSTKDPIVMISTQIKSPISQWVKPKPTPLPSSRVGVSNNDIVRSTAYTKPTVRVDISGSINSTAAQVVRKRNRVGPSKPRATQEVVMPKAEETKPPQ